MIKPLLATACAVLLLAACDSREPAQTFTFTAIPDQDESRLEQRFGKVAEHLEEALGVPVMLVGLRRYTSDENRRQAFALFYVVMNVGVLLSAPAVDVSDSTAAATHAAAPVPPP